jgi:hypothetical protein
MSRYLLLSRPQCHLCEDFAEALRSACPELAQEVAVVDIGQHPAWQQRFGLRIPVLIDDAGAVLCEGVFDARRLADNLQPP